MAVGVAVLALCVLASSFLGPAWSVPLIVLSAASFWSIARSDSRKPTCVSLHLDKPVVSRVEVLDDKVVAEVFVSRGTVARLGRHLGRVAPASVQPGLRTVPILLASDRDAVSWVESGRLLRLDPDEFRGAVSSVLGGSDVSVEVLVGSPPGRRPRVLGTHLSSDTGSVQSWSSSLRPVLYRGEFVPNYPL